MPSVSCIVSDRFGSAIIDAEQAESVGQSVPASSRANNLIVASWLMDAKNVVAEVWADLITRL
jgi:hypothetical protein